MKTDGKTVLLCDCGGTMTIDAKALGNAVGADEAPRIHTALCRRQIAAFEQAIASGAAVIVGCAQEAPLFSETAETADSGADLAFVDIRDRAGWGREGGDATPKMAALIAAAALDAAPAPAVTMESAGVTLVIGRDEHALEAARRLSGRLDVSVLLIDGQDVLPPRTAEVPVHCGTVAGATGHLGAFSLTIDGYAAADPSARRALAFGEKRDGVTVSVDLILDLGGTAALFAAPDARDGYLKPDPGDPIAVERALFDIADLVGTFDKPRYVAYDAKICTHGRSHKTGCTRCLDLCPTGAITPDGDAVAFDPFICGGCGQCAGACPTGAAGYLLPAPDSQFTRLRTLLTGYHDAGGVTPTLLVHDTRSGEDLLAAIGRFGDGLPASVLPFAVNQVAQVGLDFLLAAVAYGAVRVVLLCDGRYPDRRAGLATQVALSQAILDGLGYGTDRIAIIDDADPDRVEAYLWSAPVVAAAEPGRFLAMGGKRDRQRLALDHLHDHAPTPVDILALPPEAPFGAIAVDTAGCTLCLACVGACPTGAMRDDPDHPRLGFEEQACVQCGLCRVTCPESVITLVPRLDFTEAARRVAVLHEEEPFRCVRCDKPFGVAASIEAMVVKLKDHSMFANDPAALDRIRMCEDCRVIVQFEQDSPMSGPPRPKPRTADDIDE